MLILHRSNRVEELASSLERVLREPLADALQPEVIVVQSLGMRRWLSFEIARRFDVAMNCEFPFFADFANRVFRGAFGEEITGRAFSRDLLPWRILSAMHRRWEEPTLQPLQSYVGHDGASELKRFEIARQIASVFDRYVAYQPELLQTWAEGDAGEWQGLLWRELLQTTAETPPPALLARLQQIAASQPKPLPGLPERISVFGIASLPPFYLRLLEAAARTLEIHFFLFEPTDHYWGDILSERAQRSFLRKNARPGQTAADFHLEAGNELLASWGRAGQAFAREVLELDPDDWDEAFQEPTGTTTLERLQRDIFRLRSARNIGPIGPTESADPAFIDEGDDEKEEEEHAPFTPDASLQIHCCHSPMRELEVLHDALLDLFQTRPDLTPKDILVTIPDVGTHAPFIEAVFGAPEDERVRIPYTIADRSAAAQSSVARAFLQMLDLPGRRFTATEVLALLETAAIRERYSLSEPDLERIRAAVVRNGIRWGIDGPHRARFGVPAFSQNSWRAGLDRWLLGYAMLSDSPQLHGGMLPDPTVEGGLAVLAGQFADFAEALFTHLPGLDDERPLAEWSRLLRRLLDRFFNEASEQGAEVLAVRRALAALGELAEVHADPVSFPALRAHLQSVLGEADAGGGFLAGHVTFCSLRPMRSIPFRVICTLGLDDGAFPRRDQTLSFDLAAASRGGTARSRRDEDRQLFLESLLSAREVFYLSYTGRSPKDNSEAPPAPLVSELLDYLTARVDPGLPEGTSSSSWVTHHRLHPFSPAYFDGESGLFSYSHENLTASQAGRSARRVASMSWVDVPLPPVLPEDRRVTVQELLSCYRHPARFFMRRLRLGLPSDQDALEETEPLELNALGRWKVADGLCQSLLAGYSVEKATALIRATGQLPPSHIGQVRLEEALGKATETQRQLAAHALGDPLPPLSIDLKVGDWELTGALDGLFEKGRVEITGSTVNAKVRLRAWLQHLILNAAPGPHPRTTAVIGSTGSCEHGPREDALALLQVLLENYAEGLRRPLPFFPKASLAYAERFLDPRGGRSDPVKKGADTYRTNEGKSDPHYAFCFPQGADGWTDEWSQIALQLYRPMLQDAACATVEEEDEE